MSFSLTRSLRIILPVLLLWLLAGTGWAAPRTSNLWWLPDLASKGGEQVDQLIYFICFLTGGVFVLTQVIYIYFLIKYSARRGVRATYSHGNNRLEL
ncbi:MAG TPA: hypothetical protein VHS80_04785, partial [Chthoniobacterales bacterium]|nr:hypothetical protein [Chthoniobacterales bacterium]